MTTNLDVDEMPKWLQSIYKLSDYKNVIAGINDDDCAIIRIGKETLIISSDYLNASPIAIELGIGNYWNLGRLLVAANLSDICGTGAYAIGFISSIMLDKDNCSEDEYKNLMEGIIYELENHKIPLLGGDSKLGKATSLCGTIIGIQEQGSGLFLKNNAKVGDQIWVSGNLGGVSSSIYGVKLNNNKINEWSRDKITTPDIPYLKSRKLSKLHIANSGTDISDGLGADLWNLCSSSNVGCIVNNYDIPISEETYLIGREIGIEPWKFAFTIGGDFQFLVTVPSRHNQQMLDLGFVKIGQITDSKECYIQTKNNKIDTMPKIGHRDVNTLSFENEMDILLNLKKND